jgi:hypothetical protein
MRMTSTRSINQRGIEVVADRLRTVGADAMVTGTKEVHLIVHYPGDDRPKSMTVKATSRVQPGGGLGKLALHWWIKASIPADQVAAVDLDSTRVWLFSMEELASLAQQHSSGKHHLIMVAEPQARSKHLRYLVEHFDEYLLVPSRIDHLRAASEGVSDAALDDAVYALEGELRRRMVTHRFRERELRDSKLQDARQRHPAGRLCCEVPGCGFDFQEVYGELGAGFAHVHHLQPLKDVVGTVRTQLGDLAVVCPNCHAMIHRGGECRSLACLIPVG